MSGEFTGRAGVITGAASGIGRAIAEALAGEGASVAIYDRDGAVDAAREVGRGAIGLAGDVTDAERVAEAFADVARRFGRFDFLINNAGIRHQSPIISHPVAMWRTTIDVNLTGAFICGQAAAREMLPRGGGAIVNVASMAGLLSLTARSAYNASKAGLISLTRSMALELAADGIRCNAIAPGVIETPLSAAYFEDPEMRRILIDNTPQGRWGQVQDIIGPVMFLCGDGAAHVQGATLSVDGGWVAAKGY